MQFPRTAPLVLGLIVGPLTFAAVRPAPAGQEMPLPGPQHQELLQGVGKWEGTLTLFMPDMPSEPVAARETVQAIGGFWTLSHFECEFMGMPYIGSGHVGYDDAKKKYVGTWVDNMSSYLAVMEGEMDPTTKKLVMRWVAPDMTGAIVPHRSEHVTTADSHTMTFFVGPGEGEKSMVIAMKREGKRPAQSGSGK